MTYKQAMDYVDIISEYGSNSGLESISSLLERLGNPQDSLELIQVAGTNGKGSTVAYLENIISASKYKVGTFTSPAVREYREIIRINGKNISQKSFCDYIEKIKMICDEMVLEGETHPSIFEIETAISFLYFKDKSCDLVILETGMGGKYDSTNAAKKNIVSVITSISLDHVDILGKTLKEIAEHKCGIIKEGSTVVVAAQDEDIIDVVDETCKKRKVYYIVADSDNIKNYKVTSRYQSFSYRNWKNIQISMMGKYQVKNAILALEVVEILRVNGYNLQEELVKKALKETTWFGRMTLIHNKPDIYVDGAHNEAGIDELVGIIKDRFKDKRLIFVMGVFKDKDYKKMVEKVSNYPEYVFTITPPNKKRGLPALELADEFNKYKSNVTSCDGVDEAIEMAYLLADSNTVIISFGSLSFLGLVDRVVNKK